VRRGSCTVTSTAVSRDDRTGRHHRTTTRRYDVSMHSTVLSNGNNSHNHNMPSSANR
jgi:hypothetical protein